MIPIFAAILSFALGLSIVKCLTSWNNVRVYFITSAFLLCALMASIIPNVIDSSLIEASVVALGFVIFGFIVMSKKVLSMADPRTIPELTRIKGDPGDGHAAVIYFAHGEPETFYPIGWINQFREFDEQKIRFVPFIARPFFLYKLRNVYERVGGSRHRQEHIAMLQNLEQSFRNAGDFTSKFYLSFLDDDPRPDAAVIQALNEGASKIIISEVFLTNSNHTEEGKHMVNALQVEEYGATLVFTGPLWDSETLQGMFLDRTKRATQGVDITKVGVLLIGHGQPDEWDVNWPTETEQETLFRVRILEKFANAGYKRENLGQAWMEFKKPKPKDMIESFVKNGVETIVFFSAAMSADGIHSQYDTPNLVNKASTPKNIQVINLGAWNNDPIVIEAIKEKIDAVMLS
jgi:hypothetical protein